MNGFLLARSERGGRDKGNNPVFRFSFPPCPSALGKKSMISKTSGFMVGRSDKIIRKFVLTVEFEEYQSGGETTWNPWTNLPSWWLIQMT